MKAIQALLLSVVAVLISLFAIELVFRLLERKPVAWNDRPFAYFKPEKSETLQDYPYAKLKKASDFRIVVVGDSYSFAPYMQFSDAFPKVLERMLNLNDNASKAEVINLGVPGYSTSHEIEEVRKSISGQADLVLLQITLNDPELKPYRPIGITEFNRFGDLKPSQRMQRLYSYWRSLGYIAKRMHNTSTHREYREYFLDLFENPRSFAKFKESLQKIATLCNESKVKLVAVVFPLFGLPLDQNYPFHPIHQKVAQLLATLGVDALDLFDLYAGIPLERLQVIPGGDRHPNEIAHRMAAEKIYMWLEEKALLPEWTRIKYLYADRTRIINAPLYERPNH